MNHIQLILSAIVIGLHSLYPYNTYSDAKTHDVLSSLLKATPDTCRSTSGMYLENCLSSLRSEIYLQDVILI